jgi:hypothetical protein
VHLLVSRDAVVHGLAPGAPLHGGGGGAALVADGAGAPVEMRSCQDRLTHCHAWVHFGFGELKWRAQS